VVILTQSANHYVTSRIHMKGHVSAKSTDKYAQALLPYFQDPENLFVISR
jgi:hypothetical protein